MGERAREGGLDLGCRKLAWLLFFLQIYALSHILIAFLHIAAICFMGTATNEEVLMPTLSGSISISCAQS